MKTVEDFFKKYRIQEFYDWQAKNTKTPIAPFVPKKHKKLSFGVIPGFRNYDLFYERYLNGVNILRGEGAIKDPMKILDIGSGEGFFKFFFDAMCPEKIEWYGVEVWKERAAFCRHIGYHIDDINLEVEPLPYANETFDIVLASHVIEHLPNPDKVIAEMGRVLKKGGYMLIGTPTKPWIVAYLDAKYHKLSKRNTGDTQQAFTHRTLENLILKSLNLGKEAVVDKRGFRIFSSRKRLPLENSKWFHDVSMKLGKTWLTLVPEVNIIVKK